MEPCEVVRVLIVDDHAILREGVRMVLDALPGLQVVGDVGDGRAAVEMARQLRPDVVLMDITMPGMSGIEATREIASMGVGTRVLGLTVHDDREYFFQMLAAGASGYVLKGVSSAELAEAIRSVSRGGVYLTPQLARQMVGEYLRYRSKAMTAGEDGLTPREVEVLRMIAGGLTNQEIAASLHLSVYTVQTHRAHIMRKLDLEGRRQLIQYALRKGYLDAPPAC